MPKRDFRIADMTPFALAEGPAQATPEAYELMRELRHLGLSNEAALGIVNVLTRSGSRTIENDPSDW